MLFIANEFRLLFLVYAQNIKKIFDSILNRIIQLRDFHERKYIKLVSVD